MFRKKVRWECCCFGGVFEGIPASISLQRNTNREIDQIVPPLLFQMHSSCMIIQICNFQKYAYKMSTLFHNWWVQVDAGKKQTKNLWKIVARPWPWSQISQSEVMKGLACTICARCQGSDEHSICLNLNSSSRYFPKKNCFRNLHHNVVTFFLACQQSNELLNYLILRNL